MNGNYLQHCSISVNMPKQSFSAVSIPVSSSILETVAASTFLYVLCDCSIAKSYTDLLINYCSKKLNLLDLNLKSNPNKPLQTTTVKTYKTNNLLNAVIKSYM